ncbi:MAG: glycosyltransferase family 2 protein [Candidatus Omnitrophota bacterium]|nr:MAG: glycosyltransferase family 2 protein [Candidatus Omnitrophota bacterium]
MSNKPGISIGMPVYNGEKYLCEVIDSILNQTFSDFELIISDNGSTDRTEEICRAYAARDSRVCYYRNEENRGAAWNFNRVFELAKGEYFKWAAVDDLCEPSFLQRCVEVLDGDSSVAVAFTKSKFIDNLGNLIEERDPVWDLQMESTYQRFRQAILSSWRKCNVIFGLIRSNLLAKTKLMGDYAGQDYHLVAELSLLGKFFKIHEYLFMRRLHSEASKWQGLKFYKPQGGNRIVKSIFQISGVFRLSGAYLKTIYQAQFSMFEKLFLTGTILYLLCRCLCWQLKQSLIKKYKKI